VKEFQVEFLASENAPLTATAKVIVGGSRSVEKDAVTLSMDGKTCSWLPPRPDQAILSRFAQWKPPVRDDGDLTNDVAKRLIEAERDGSAEGLTWASYDR